MLRLGRRQAETVGVALDVGDTKDAEPVTPEGTGEGTEPVELLARILAHIGHRLPFVKKVEKRLEGTDKSSGILADIGSLLMQIYRRNEPQIQNAAEQVVAARRAAKANGVPPHAQHAEPSVVHPDTP